MSGCQEGHKSGRPSAALPLQNGTETTVSSQKKCMDTPVKLTKRMCNSNVWGGGWEWGEPITALPQMEWPSVCLSLPRVSRCRGCDLCLTITSTMHSVSTLLSALGGLSYFILLPKKEHDPHFLRRKGRPRD